jgi:hypothetical protein
MGWNELDCAGSGQKPAEEPCEHGNETFGCIICRKFLEQLQNCQRLEKGPTHMELRANVVMYMSNPACYYLIFKNKDLFKI